METSGVALSGFTLGLLPPFFSKAFTQTVSNEAMRSHYPFNHKGGSMRERETPESGNLWSAVGGNLQIFVGDS